MRASLVFIVCRTKTAPTFGDSMRRPQGLDGDIANAPAPVFEWYRDRASALLDSFDPE
jgi:hypothetical protein